MAKEMASSLSSSVHCSPLLVLIALIVTCGFCEEIPSGFFTSSKQQIDSSAPPPYSLDGSNLVAVGYGIEGIDSHMDGSEASFAKLQAGRLDTRLVAAVEGFDPFCCSAAKEAGLNACAAGAAGALVDAFDVFVFKPVDGFDAIVFAAGLAADAFQADTGVIVLADELVHVAQAVGSVFESLTTGSTGVLVDVALVSTTSNMDAPVPLNLVSGISIPPTNLFRASDLFIGEDATLAWCTCEGSRLRDWMLQCFYLLCMCPGKMLCSEQDLRIAKMRPCYWFWKEYTDEPSIATLNCCLCRSGHANSSVRAARRQLLLLLPLSPTNDEDWYAQLSPVKHILHLRLNNFQPQVPSPRRQPEGSPAGQSACINEAFRCTRCGCLVDSIANHTVGPQRVHRPLKHDIESEIISKINLLSSFLWCESHGAVQSSSFVARQLQQCNRGMSFPNSVLCFY